MLIPIRLAGFHLEQGSFEAGSFEKGSFLEKNSTRLRRACFVAASLLCLIGAPALGQEQPSMVELKAAAYDAQQAAADAQAAAAAAQAQAAEAKAAIDQAAAPPPAPAPAPVSAPPPPVAAPAAAPPAAPVVVIQTPAPAPVPVAPAPPPPAPAATQAVATTPEPAVEEEPPVTREELQRAIEKAEQAAAAARRAQEELDAYKEKRRLRYARKGLTMSAGAFWAPQLFDSSVDIDHSRGLNGSLGYRVHRHFSLEASFTWVEGFAVDTTSDDGTGLVGYQGDFSMWAALFGGKVYFLTGKIQPYLGMGFGAAGGNGTFTDVNGGPDWKIDEVAGVISFNGGLEMYVSESLAIGADASVFLPGGELRGLDFSTLGAKVIYRF